MTLLDEFDGAVAEEDILAMAVMIDAVAGKQLLVEFKCKRLGEILRDVFE